MRPVELGRNEPEEKEIAKEALLPGRRMQATVASLCLLSVGGGTFSIEPSQRLFGSRNRPSERR